MNLPHQHATRANANPPAAGVSPALIGAFYSHSRTPRSSSACKRAKSALTAADAHSCAATETERELRIAQERIAQLEREREVERRLFRDLRVTA